jgi:hypothetical protein
MYVGVLYQISLLPCVQIRDGYEFTFYHQHVHISIGELFSIYFNRIQHKSMIF